jgi:hypothetical protein
MSSGRFCLTGIPGRLKAIIPETPDSVKHPAQPRTGLCSRLNTADLA